MLFSEMSVARLLLLPYIDKHRFHKANKGSCRGEYQYSLWSALKRS